MFNYICWIDIEWEKVKIKRISNQKWYDYEELLENIKNQIDNLDKSSICKVQFMAEYKEVLDVLKFFVVDIPIIYKIRKNGI